MSASFAGVADKLLDAAARAQPLPVTDVRFDTPVPWPHTLIAIPVNYRAHEVEMSSPAISRNAGFFVKSAASLSGASDPVVLPELPGRSIHHEAELAVIIGRRAPQGGRGEEPRYRFLFLSSLALLPARMEV